MANSTDPADERIDLPDELAAHLADASGLDEPPATLSDWAADFEARADLAGAGMGDEDLFTDEETRHEVDVEGRLRHTPCVVDALEAAFLADDERVSVRSTDPTSGGTVTFEVDGDRVDATPADAIVSLGLASDLPEPDDDDSPLAAWLGGDGVDDDVREYACAYINAFESRENYRTWTETVDAVTAPLSVPQAAAVARWGVESPLFD